MPWSASSASTVLPDTSAPETGRPQFVQCFMPLTGDNAGSRRFAFVLIDPSSPCPGFLLRRAFEVAGGNPTVGLAASHYEAMLALFPSQEVREEVMGRFPLAYLGHTISMERPELAENRFGWRYSKFAQLSAFGFPLEHWNEGGIRTAFRPIGSVCCIDPLCLNELDYSAVRLVLHLENEQLVPLSLLLRDFEGETTTEVKLEVVRSWASSTPFSHDGHFAGGGGDTPCRGGGGSPRWGQPSSPSSAGGALDDIDSDSVNELEVIDLTSSDDGPAEPLPSYGPTCNAPPVDLWNRIVARRNRDLSPAGPLGLGQVGGPASAATSVVLWDRILARRLAAQFPDSGLDADQPSSLVFAVASDDHEDAVRKQRVRRKRAADSAFKARRSERLATKEPDMFVDMLTRAKEVKAAKFDSSRGSPRLRTALATLCIDDRVPGPIPLPLLQDLGAPCGVDPAALASAEAVPTVDA
ncbi:unnamed protein product [Alopecurus aequalis]